jgi:putative membrane protein
MQEVLARTTATAWRSFLVLEIFLWDKPFGLRTFGMTPDSAAVSKKLAANQGMYNGFPAAGHPTKIFFLAGIVRWGRSAGGR